MSNISVRFIRVECLHAVGGAREPAESRVRGNATNRVLRPPLTSASDADWFACRFGTGSGGNTTGSSSCFNAQLRVLRAMKERKKRDTQIVIHVLHQCERVRCSRFASTPCFEASRQPKRYLRGVENNSNRAIERQPRCPCSLKATQSFPEQQADPSVAPSGCHHGETPHGRTRSTASGGPLVHRPNRQGGRQLGSPVRQSRPAGVQ